MISCDTIIENNSCILRNLNLHSVEFDTWSSGSNMYNAHEIKYEKPIIKGHLYYFQCVYKYTTTNQRPTWARIYSQSGNISTRASVENPEPNTEYVLSATVWGQSTGPVDKGYVYNGPYGAINGVMAYVKNVICYDVTSLYYTLKSMGIVTNDIAMATWCQSNLQYVNNGVNYDLTNTIDALSKTVFCEGNLLSTPIECDGMEFYSANSEYRGLTYFDNDFQPLVRIYNNNNGTVTITKVSAKDKNSPFYNEHPYVLEIKTNGEAKPSCGGIYTLYTAAANKIFVQRFVAKIPVGYQLESVGNTPLDNVTREWLTPVDGTGEWQEYAIALKYKSSGSFSSDGHIYLSAKDGSSATSVTWYLAYINVCDITENEDLKNYTALPNKDAIKGKHLFTRNINTSNFIPNGKCTDLNMTLPNGWEFDTTDVVGDCKASIVQNVGANRDKIFGKIKINPSSKYKLSFWVKCKGDMPSFSTAIQYYVANDKAVVHRDVVYLANTQTTLTQNLVSGDTQMVVSSNKNWVDKAYSGIGFRTYNSSYNDKGLFVNTTLQNGIVSGVSGTTIITFKTPYNGETIPSGTYVVESYDGATYPYPITKNLLPTDNTWKYVEGYLGNDTIWDGASNSGWLSIPMHAVSMEIWLNLYTNNGSVPIKYCDIKLEEIGNNGSGERNENKIQFLKHN